MEPRLTLLHFTILGEVLNQKINESISLVQFKAGEMKAPLKNPAVGKFASIDGKAKKISSNFIKI